MNKLVAWRQGMGLWKLTGQDADGIVVVHDIIE